MMGGGEGGGIEVFFTEDAVIRHHKIAGFLPERKYAEYKTEGGEWRMWLCTLSTLGRCSTLQSSTGLLKRSLLYLGTTFPLPHLPRVRGRTGFFMHPVQENVTWLITGPQCLLLRPTIYSHYKEKYINWAFPRRIYSWQKLPGKKKRNE